MLSTPRESNPAPIIFSVENLPKGAMPYYDTGFADCLSLDSDGISIKVSKLRKTLLSIFEIRMNNDHEIYELMKERMTSLVERAKAPGIMLIPIKSYEVDVASKKNVLKAGMLYIRSDVARYEPSSWSPPYIPKSIQMDWLSSSAQELLVAASVMGS